MFRLIMLVTLALAMSSCSTMPSTAFHLPANLAQSCEPLPTLADGQQQTLAAWIVDAAGLYHDCANRHAETVKAIQGNK